MSQRERFSQTVRILRRGHTTAEHLAETFNVSVRTVYRDIAALRDQGVPVVGEPGIGYHLGTGALLEGVQLSTAELEALLLSTRRALEYADPATAHALCGLQRKVDAAMPTALRDALRLPDNDVEPLRRAG